jgi:hypothetical protein
MNNTQEILYRLKGRVLEACHALGVLCEWTNDSERRLTIFHFSKPVDGKIRASNYTLGWVVLDYCIDEDYIFYKIFEYMHNSILKES